jgi:beta-lactamase regulating signal transducer with metallopeptidase domain
MSDFLMTLLNMSLAANWLIVTVILLRLIIRKAPRRIICLLWGLVAIRLICPVSIERSFGVIPLEEVITADDISELQHKWNTIAGVEPVQEYLGDIYHDGAAVAYGYGNSLIFWLEVIWTCGSCGLLLYAAIVSLNVRRYLKEAVRYQGNCYLCDHVRSPFIFGFFRPHIYLPTGLDESDMEYALAHEKAHLQRKDHIWKVAAFFLLVVYWFDPLSWATFILFCRDIELACDEKVIQNLSMPEKKAYANSLLSCSVKKRLMIVYPLTFGEIGVKQRVKFILNYKKPGFWAVSFSSLACVMIGICFLMTLPQKSQTTVMMPADASPMQIQKYKKENKSPNSLLCSR